MLLDLCHILNQFYAELPTDYEEFKVMANAVFPRYCTLCPSQIQLNVKLHTLDVDSIKPKVNVLLLTCFIVSELK